jgi:hypothetical protein
MYTAHKITQGTYTVSIDEMLVYKNNRFVCDRNNKHITQTRSTVSIMIHDYSPKTGNLKLLAIDLSR